MQVLAKLNGKKGLIATILTMAILIGAYNGMYYNWTVSYSINPLTQDISITIPETSGATSGENLAAKWIPSAIGDAYAWYAYGGPAHKGFSSAELYVWDGWVDWAEVSMPFDIAIEDISELKFWKMVEYFDSGWNPNLYLGIDDNGNGLFEGDILAYHQARAAGKTASEAADLYVKPDAFIALECPTGLTVPDTDFVSVDAFTMSSWAVDSDGEVPYEYGAGLAQFQAASVGRIDPGDHVLMIKLEIGGAGSWMDEIAYVDDVTINGESYDIDAVVASFNIVKPCDVWFMVTGDDRLDLWSDYFELYVEIYIFFDGLYDDVGSAYLDVLTGEPPSGDVSDYVYSLEAGTYYAVVWVEYWTGAVTGTVSGDFVINVFAEED